MMTFVGRQALEARPPVMIADEVDSDPEQVMAPMSVVGVRDSGAKKSIVRLLKQVVGEPVVARRPRQICPHRASRSIVERAERVLVHLKRHIEGVGRLAQPFDV